MTEIDLINRKILYELDTNCRQSNSRIAKKLKISKDVVHYRIKKLEEARIIEGYRAIIDISKLGYVTYRVYLKFQNMYKEVEDELIENLKQTPHVCWVGKLVGRVDFVFVLWVKTPATFYDFWIGFLKKYRRYIKQEVISTFIEYIHFSRTYLLGTERDEARTEIIGRGEKIKYDKTDAKILSLLAENARIPLLALAVESNLTPMAVKYRMKNLTKRGVIQGYRCFINFSKIGYEYYKVDMYLEDISKMKQLESFCHQHPNIVYIDRTFGAGDIEFDFEIESFTKFTKVMEEIKNTFKGVIRNFEFFSVIKIYKTLYFPICESEFSKSS